MGIQALSQTYPVWLCDVWGVLHDGRRSFPDAVDALVRHRRNKGCVILLTNSPRLPQDIRHQLAALDISDHAYDDIISSGLVTRHLLAALERDQVKWKPVNRSVTLQNISDDHVISTEVSSTSVDRDPGGEKEIKHKIYHIGPHRDLPILNDLPLELTVLEKADCVLCTGLFDDRHESPEDYDSILTQMKEKKLDMICANPDKIVHRGAELIYCAGALAERYSKLGGRVLMAGKPHAPIYALSLQIAQKLCHAGIEKSSILAIGDGPETDIKGAADNGFDVVFISNGIAKADKRDVNAQLTHAAPNANIVASLPQLSW